MNATSELVMRSHKMKPTPDNDPVYHPAHYTSDPSGVECIQITRHRNFNIGNAIKYLWRAGLKDEGKTIEDLKKAIFYITDEIVRLERLHIKSITSETGPEPAQPQPRPSGRMCPTCKGGTFAGVDSDGKAFEYCFVCKLKL